MKRVEGAILDSKLQPAVKAKGYRILGCWENGFRNITNNVRPINEPADLKGIKLRTPKGAWRVKMFKGYGANPTPMAFSEVFTALQTGVIDGQENPYAQICVGQVPGGAEVSVGHRPRLHAGLCAGFRQALLRSCRRRPGRR